MKNSFLNPNPKIILYIATSADGFIADRNGGVDWLPQGDKSTDEEFGYTALMNRISTIIMGRHSYEQILCFGEWTWKDKTTYVFTSNPLTTNIPNISFVHEDVKTFFIDLKKQKINHNTWLLGGSKLITSFAKEKLIDECIITVVPINLGAGIKLELPYEDFTLVHSKECRLGITQNFYIKKHS